MKKLLIVDDNKENLIMLKAILEDEYQVTPVSSGRLALDFLAKKDADLILLDVQMPEMSGLDVIEIIKKDEKLSKIPVLFLTGVESADVEVECLEKGGDDYIRKPYDSVVLKQRIARLLELYGLRYGLESALLEKSIQLDRMALSTIITIANTVDAKDKYTGGHSLRVAVCSRDIAASLGWDEKEVQNVYNVALLHDIGKIAVPDSVLNKPGRLDDDEFEIIKQHPVTGNEILRDINILEHVQEGAHYHHERWDGKGYPCGLAGEEIPVYARIIALADTFDAMRSDRVYRKHLSMEKIISEFERCKGTQFDPDIDDVFIFMLKGGYDVDPEIVQQMANAEKKSAGDNQNVPTVKLSGAVKLDAEQDSLTGLFNRSYLNMKVGSRIIKDKSGALLLIDMDKFKLVNEKFGHFEGDRILKQFADELRSQFREDDIVCRMSGDEFAVFVSGEVNVEYIRQKAQSVIDNVRMGDLSGKYDKMLSVSIGISMCPRDGITFEELYSCAGKALYRGMQNGISMYHFFGDNEENVQFDSTKEDMKRIKELIEGKFKDEEGALSVQYDDFRNIYNYVYRYVDRNDTHVQIILFTITPASGREIPLSILEQSMHSLDIAVVESLRKVDVGTRYSSNQYIVILTDTNADNGRMVANRVSEQYYKLADSDVTQVVYDLETLEPKKD